MGPWLSVCLTATCRKLYAALNNCGFVSTEDMANDPSAPFAFLMDASMLGVGVGFDTKVRGPLASRRSNALDIVTQRPT